MKSILFWLLTAVGVISAVGVGYARLSGAWGSSSAERFRTMPVRRGDITLIVNSTGTVQPVQSVQVGSFVSGPIEEVYVDFNDRVKAGDVLAQVDPRTYKANVAREEAALAHQQADQKRVEALLEQAARNEERALKLRKTKKTFISEAEVDQYVAERKSLEAQLELAKASVRQAEASLASAQTNLEFTEIKSPVDGMIIDRLVDTGQTVASQFQTPVLFLVAPDLEKKVYVYASVDEADIGLIRDAEKRRQPVEFTVDAYPDDTFKGHIAQIRLNPTTVQNVVTYTVVVESPNADLKLLPGMTATLSFQIEKHEGILMIPNSALRFRPKPDQVQPRYRPLLESVAGDEELEEAEEDPKKASPGGVPRHKLDETHKRVWVVDGELAAPIDVEIGISDNLHTELISENLAEGRELIAGLRSAAPAAAP